MSEQPGGARPAGGKILGMRPGTFYLVAAGVAVVGGLAFFWWRNYQASQAAAATTTTGTTTAAGTTGSTDYGPELSVIQTELESLLQQQGTGTATTGTTGTTGATTTASAPATAPFAVAVPNGTGGWMEAVFPGGQAAVNSYYRSLGIKPGGGYPNGLSNAQITQAVQGAGGSIANPVANSGPGGLVQ